MERKSKRQARFCRVGVNPSVWRFIVGVSVWWVPLRCTHPTAIRGLVVGWSGNEAHKNLQSKTRIHKDRLWLSKLLVLAVFTLLSLTAFNADAQARNVPIKAPQAARDGLARGQAQDLIIVLDVEDIQSKASDMRRKAGRMHDNAAILGFKSARYAGVKQDVLSVLPANEVVVLQEYVHLPMVFARVHTLTALIRLEQHLDVAGIYENGENFPVLNQSLPLINQIQAVQSGFLGAGTTVAVLDTGTDYTLPAFGSCTSPGVPPGCRVSFARDFAPDDGALDDDGHGTNVAAIVLGVAPAANIAALDVFSSGGGASDVNILKAIDWSINNQSAFNIAALNLSLGKSAKQTMECTGSVFTLAFRDVRAAGILPVVASGNDGYKDGLVEPACAPGAVRVGAVYDANVGGIQWRNCTDSSTAADQVTCFSNSAPYLTLLAPGALISAAGRTLGGTSQATPHVAGAVAVLRAANAFPGDSVDETVIRLTSTGVPVRDAGNGLVTPRIDLEAAIGTSPPMGADLTVSLSGSPNPTVVGNPIDYDAIIENLGPSIANNVTAIAALPPDVRFVSASSACTHTNGTVTCTIGTLPSSASATVQITVIADVAGQLGQTVAVTSTTADPVSANDTDTVTTTVNLAPDADLSITQSDSPDPVPVGMDLTYTVTITNSGPDPATGVELVDTLPAGFSNVRCSGCGSCTLGGGVLTCPINDMSPGANANWTLIVTPLATGQITNLAEVRSSISDSDLSNNMISEASLVTAAADLQISKVATPDPVILGDDLTYTIAVSNTGPSLASDVTVRDTIPSGTVFVSASSGCTEAGGVVTCITSTLANGAAVSWDIVLRPTAAGNLVNTASVSSTTADPDTTNNSASAFSTVDLPEFSVVLMDAFNLFAYPGGPPAGQTCSQLQGFLGANRIAMLDAASQTLIDCPGDASDFPIVAGEGYILEMPAGGQFSLPASVVCPVIDLMPGANLIGVPVPAATLSCYQMLLAIGDSQTVGAVQRLDPVSGLYETCAFDPNGAGNNPIGTDFPIVSGQAYWVSMLQSVSGVALNDPAGCQP